MTVSDLTLIEAAIKRGMPIVFDTGDRWIPLEAEVIEGETTEGKKLFIVLREHGK